MALIPIDVKVLDEGEPAESILARLSVPLGTAPDRNVPRTARFLLGDYDTPHEAAVMVRAELDRIDPDWVKVLRVG